MSGAQYKLLAPTEKSKHDTFTIHPLASKEAMGMCHLNTKQLNAVAETLAHKPALRHLVLYLASIREPFNAKHLAIIANRSEASCRSNLPKLAALCLVKKVGRGLWLETVSDESIGSAAVATATIGKRARIEAKNSEQRNAFRLLNCEPSVLKTELPIYQCHTSASEASKVLQSHARRATPQLVDFAQVELFHELRSRNSVSRWDALNPFAHSGRLRRSQTL